ncbi:hypothetical protein [Arthrobacter sp. efr-133-TYG-104]|uniref:hypothetical protein n=1 Tax=Arthrobacter sp. efr-133-TYG-104 TaxID=3040324 RepID=UPI00254BF519|nr:hypothetical protein [Arthrobacter sp. efr-133-TYG-104]
MLNSDADPGLEAALRTRTAQMRIALGGQQEKRLEESRSGPDRYVMEKRGSPWRKEGHRGGNGRRNDPRQERNGNGHHTPTCTQRPGCSGTANGVKDFVAIDDSGAFTYHGSEPVLLAAFEYVGEASCIIDRHGDSYDLALDPNRHLILGRAHVPAEFHWLRQALMDAREYHLDKHRLRRFYPDTPDERPVQDLLHRSRCSDRPSLRGANAAI